MPGFVDRLTRRKYVTFEDRNLARVLNTIDLTALGIGSTVGVGFYVLAGKVARDVAGPAVTISFLIAAVASVFAGLCYAEFGARVPKAGSAYIYTYVCVGEFVSFVIGWNLILEYVIGAASVATGFSGYVDQLTYNKISGTLTEAMPINISFLSDYPDFLAFGLSLALTGILCVGVKESSLMNNIFTLINMVVIMYVIIAAGTQGDSENWSIPESKLNETCQNMTSPIGGWGVGGFAPYGFNGIMQGAATCFFGFVGFDVIATTGEEAINPERTIPIAIGLSLLLVFLAYFGMASVITLALPYCREDVDAPLVYLFQYFGWETAKWIVSVGALFGFSASLFGAMFPLPRIIFAMADDGLLFRTLSKINRVFHTPVIATVLSGLLAGLMALVFDLSSLIDMMSIGTLMAYGIVALSVMLLRYAADEDVEPQAINESQCILPNNSNSTYFFKDYFLQFFNRKGLKEPNDLTASLVSYATLLFFVIALPLNILLVVAGDQIVSGDGGAISAVVILAVLIVIILSVIACQPESKKKLTFKVPLVPWLPAFSAFFNVYLMCNLSAETWIRFGIWMVIGLLIYFGYGLKHSTEEQRSGRSVHGLNNPGYVGGRGQIAVKTALVIPTIEIHPATPTNSEPNTPTVSQKIKQKTQIPPSPLVTAKAETKQPVKTIVDNSENSNGHIQNTFASLNQLISNSSEGKKERLESETDGSYLDDDNETSSLHPEDNQNNLVDHSEDKKDLPPLQAEVSSACADYEKQSSSENKDLSYTGNSGVATLSLESVQHVVGKKNEVLDCCEENEPNESKNATLQDVTSETTEMRKFTEEVKVGSENDLKSDAEDKKQVLATEFLQETGHSELSHEHIKGGEPLYTTADIKIKKKSEALIIECDNDNPVENDAKDQPLLRSSQSAPVLPPPPPPPPPNFAGYSYSSVPNTPVSKRHPFKILKRMSSFDDIPPSSPDSPLARRLGNKFVIIPVNERRADSDNDSSSQISPRVSPLATKEMPETQQETLMNELISKLGFQSELDTKDVTEEENRKHLMFTVASDDSLDSASLGTNSDSFVNDLTSSALTSQTREYKKVFIKESMLEVLDTIRERGESKILHSDEDKPEIKALVPENEKLVDTNSLSAQEKNSEEKDSENISTAMDTVLKENDNKTDNALQQENKAASDLRDNSPNEGFSKLRALFDG
ncbi:uncharacterized protein [Panulirus ornatus]|uniref:uncharacterized protein isoform X2 n=1 Tax=Panulirus ornatus TaxID=150431 RepID=UPI003A85128B